MNLSWDIADENICNPIIFQIQIQCWLVKLRKPFGKWFRTYIEKKLNPERFQFGNEIFDLLVSYGIYCRVFQMCNLRDSCRNFNSAYCLNIGGIKFSPCISFHLQVLLVPTKVISRFLSNVVSSQTLLASINARHKLIRVQSYLHAAPKKTALNIFCQRCFRD